MKRSTFLKSLAAAAAIPFLPKTSNSKEKFPENDFRCRNKYPLTIDESYIVPDRIEQVSEYRYILLFDKFPSILCGGTLGKVLYSPHSQNIFYLVSFRNFRNGPGEVEIMPCTSNVRLSSEDKSFHLISNAIVV